MLLQKKYTKVRLFAYPLCILGLLIFIFSPLHIVHGETPDQLDTGETYVRGIVLQITQEKIENFANMKSYQEELQVKLLEGRQKNMIVTIPFAWDPTLGTVQHINKGEMIIVDSKNESSVNTFYSVYQPYRINTLLWILALFAVLIIIIAGMKGFGALIGLSISLGTILFFIMPQILNGQDPLRICIIGACFILIITTYVAHGISLKTSIALFSTALSLIIAAILSIVLVNILHIVGIGNQSDYALQLATTKFIHPQGLLLGGIIIGTLGALNDITTTQSITIFTLIKENRNQQFFHLFAKSMKIGKEHIASLINTLVLAYAGSSFALFLYITFNPIHLPLWFIINDDSMMEEIIRAIVGSVALILAVPITSLLACFFVLQKEKLQMKKN